VWLNSGEDSYVNTDYLREILRIENTVVALGENGSSYIIYECADADEAKEKMDILVNNLSVVELLNFNVKE
jgi:hypothetical protein